jgi:hypothetical protein
MMLSTYHLRFNNQAEQRAALKINVSFCTFEMRVGIRTCGISRIVVILRPAKDWEILNCRLVTQHYKMH